MIRGYYMSSNLQQYYDSQPIDYKSIVREFNKTIHENRFFINKEYLLRNCKDIKFNKDVWIMRPEFFCSDHYGHPFLSRIILLVNNLKSIFEFIPENVTNNYIKAPKINSVINILQL
jgi:hypothetical protein